MIKSALHASGSAIVDACDWTHPNMEAAEQEEPIDDQLVEIPEDTEGTHQPGTSVHDTDDQNYSKSWRNE